MQQDERPTATTLTGLLAGLNIGESLTFYPGLGRQPVGYAYRSDFAYYVAGPSFEYGGHPLGHVCANVGRDTYNVGLAPADRIYCLPSAEAAGLKLSYLVLSDLPVAA
jgi:hypothetical protein